MTRIVLSRENMLRNISTGRYAALVFIFLFCLFTAPSYAHAAGFQVDTNGTLTTGLVSYYKLDEASAGATPTDSWGTRDLTNFNSIAFDGGKIGNAATSGPSNANKHLLNNADNYGIDGGNISISCWFNEATAPTSGSWDVIAAQGSAASHVSYAIVHASDGTMKFWRYYTGAFPYYVSAPYTITLGTWYHAVLTYDGTSLHGWINGADQGSSTTSGTGASGASSGFELFSADDIQGSNSIFSGKVDECGIWNKKLSNPEIADLYNSGSGDSLVSGPSISSALHQYMSNATTTIGVGSTTTESTVVFGATLNSGGTSTVQLQVETEPAGTSFIGMANTSSSFVSSGSSTTATVQNLANGSYRWQARAKNSNGATSTWQLFGPNSTSTDFIVAVPMSAYFNGSSSWRWPATRLGLNSTDPFTTEFWYKSSSTATMQLLDTRSNSTSSGFAISRDPNGINFFLNCGNTTTTIQLSGAQYRSNHVPFNGPVWHHVAITKASTISSTDAFKLYFDTVQQAGDKCYSSTSTDSIWIPGNPSSSVSLFKGNIDEVRIWKTERSSSSIATYYNQEVTSTDTNLLGYWRFNGTSTDLFAGNATSGQTGNPTFSTSTPFGHFVEDPSSFSVTSSQIRWYGSTKYSDLWLSAVGTWNAEGPIVISSTTASTTALIVLDVSSTALSVAQYTAPWGVAGASTSSIELNSYFLGTYSSSSIQDTIAHELGHALGLDHSWYGNLMNYYVTSQTSTGPQDKNDYHYLWGY